MLLLTPTSILDTGSKRALTHLAALLLCWLLVLRAPLFVAKLVGLSELVEAVGFLGVVRDEVGALLVVVGGGVGVVECLLPARGAFLDDN